MKQGGRAMVCAICGGGRLCHRAKERADMERPLLRVLRTLTSLRTGHPLFIYSSSSLFQPVPSVVLLQERSTRHEPKCFSLGSHLVSCTPKTSSSSDAFLQIVHLDNVRSVYPLQNQLCNAVSLLHLEILLAVVEQQHFDLATVICINHPRTGIDEILRC